MEFFEILVAQDQRTSRRETERNNAARLAFSQHKVNSRGLGTVRRETAIRFDVVFLTEPLFVQGSSVISRPSAVIDPVGSAGIWQWDRNPKGHYVGAFIYLTVSLGEMFFETAGDSVQMTHHLLFQGIGYKDLGQAVTTEAQLMSPRTVGFGV